MRTYCAPGLKLLGLSPDPHSSPLRQALFLFPFYRCGDLGETVAEQVWGRGRAPGPGKEVGVAGWG